MPAALCSSEMDGSELLRFEKICSRLVADQPKIVELDIDPLLADENGVVAPTPASSSPWLCGPADRLAIKPYPSELEETPASREWRPAS